MSSAADVMGALRTISILFYFLGCSVYGTTYQAYLGFIFSFSVDCYLDFIINITIAECFNLCNFRERCLHIVYGSEDDLNFSFCFVSQCSALIFPDLWDFSPEWNLTTHVRNCAGNNVIGEHSQER